MDKRYSAVNVALCHSPRTEYCLGYYVVMERADMTCNFIFGEAAAEMLRRRRCKKA